MKILKSKRKGNTVSLEVQESSEAIEKAIHIAFKKIVKNASVPGFRKGKVPRDIFEKTYGKDMLIEEGVQEAVNKAYQQSILELDLKVIDYPKNLNIGEYKESADISFTCDVDVVPEVKLGKYKGIKIKTDKIKVEKEQIETQINQLKEKAAEYVTVERPIQENDIVRAHTEAKIDDYAYEPWTRKNTGLKVGLGSFGKEFDEQVTGLKNNEVKNFSITYPDTFEIKDIAGKEVHFTVEIAERSEEHTSELPVTL